VPNNAFRLTVAGLVSRTQQFSLQDLHFNFNERSFASGQTDRFSAEGESRPRRRLCEGGLPIDQPIGTKGGMCPSSTFTRPISAPSRDRSVATPRPRLGTRFDLVNDRATARLIPSLEPASLSGASPYHFWWTRVKVRPPKKLCPRFTH
jgi:hypothetical protein